MTDRHDNIAKLIKRVADHIGITTLLEPRPLGLTRKRPDLDLDLFDFSAYCDVAIVHPLSKSHVARAQIPLGAAEFREAEKRKKFQHISQLEKSHFYPFVLETLGAIGNAAQKVLGMLATGARYVPVQFRGPSGFRLHLVSALSIALQRGNAMAIFEGANRPPSIPTALRGR